MATPNDLTKYGYMPGARPYNWPVPQPTATTPPAGRQRLTANTTYYVRTDGSDSLDGTADSSLSSWQTWQHALSWVSQNIDFNGFNVTIQHGSEIGPKTFTAPSDYPVMDLGYLSFVGGGTLLIQGNSSDIATPSNCILQGSGSGCFAISTGYNGPVQTILRGFGLRPSDPSGENCIQIYGACSFVYGWIDFGSSFHDVDAVAAGAQIWESGPCTISGGSDVHWAIEGSGTSLAISPANLPSNPQSPNSWTYTITNNPSFAKAFAWINDNASLINWGVLTGFTGAATGQRFLVERGGNIYMGPDSSSDMSFLPGSTAGIIRSGGIYNNTADVGIHSDAGYIGLYQNDPTNSNYPTAEIDLGFRNGAAYPGSGYASLAGFNLNPPDGGSGWRWEIKLSDGTLETGVNDVGSNFQLVRYLNDVSKSSTPIFIQRSNGAIQFQDAYAQIVGLEQGPGNGWAGLEFIYSNTASSHGATYIASYNSKSSATMPPLVGPDSIDLKRWEIDIGDSSTESGGNTGSNFVIARYDDSGTLIPGIPSQSGGDVSWVFVINRATGIVSHAVGLGGKADASNAPAGVVGEEISSVVAVTTTTLATGVAQDTTTIVLTAGDWDVEGEVWFVGSAAVTLCSGGISTTAASIPSSPAVGQSRATSNASQAAGTTVFPLAACRVNVSASTTMHLGVSATFASGTVTAGGKLRARRRR